jgi:hypothetical protein
MSFDLFLYHFENGDSAGADRGAVKDVIRRYGNPKRDEYGRYTALLPDGSSITVSADELETEGAFTGCAFHLHGISIDDCGFILDLAVAGDMVIFNAQGRDEPDNPVMILSRKAQADQVPKEMYKHAIVVTSAQHLYALLEGSFEGWARFRDQVLRRSGEQ